MLSGSSGPFGVGSGSMVGEGEGGSGIFSVVWHGNNLNANANLLKVGRNAASRVASRCVFLNSCLQEA